MQLNIHELATLLKTNRRRAHRMSKYLSFPFVWQKNRQIFIFDKDHPFCKSLRLCRSIETKPIYSLREIASKWNIQTRRGTSVHMSELDVPIINKQYKGFIYLSDIVDIRKKRHRKETAEK